MATFSVSQIKTLIADFNKKLNLVMPTGDYSAVRQFPTGLVFAHSCVFGDQTNFGDNTKFGSNCNFGNFTVFGKSTIIGDDANIGHRAEVGDGSDIGEGTRFGVSAYFDDNVTMSRVHVGNDSHFGKGCKIGHFVRLGDGCVLIHGVSIRNTVTFGSDLRVRGTVYLITTSSVGKDQHKDVVRELKHYSYSSSTTATPVLAFSGGGSAGRTTYFFNTKDGVFVRSGCFRGTLKQFRAKVKRDCRSPNSVKRLQYLGFANIVCVTWGYKDQVE